MKRRQMLTQGFVALVAASAFGCGAGGDGLVNSASDSGGAGTLTAPSGGQLATKVSVDDIVADSAAGQVSLSPRAKQLNASGKVSWQVQDRGVSNQGFLNAPVQVIVDGDGSTYVLDMGNSKIQSYTAGGSPNGTIGSPDASFGQLSYPGGFALDAQAGLFYVANTPVGQIVVLNRSGSVVRVFGELGTEPGKLNGPRGLALDKAGNLHIVESGNGRVSVFTTSGSYIRSYGSPGSNLGQFQTPHSIVIVGNDSLVSDPVAGFITRFDSNGAAVSRFKPTTAAGVPVAPLGLSLGLNGTLYIHARPGTPA
jgi:sugar lactone lactonase YvrE